MSWTRRRLQALVTWAILVAWLVFYAIALANADPLPTVDVAVFYLVVPPLLWVIAVRLVLREVWLVLRPRWSRAGSGISALDAPGRFLAIAAAVLPKHRREWGTAMIAELAEVQGRSARWRFALSSVRATLLLRPAGGWPVLAVVAGTAVAATTAAGPVVGRAVPGLRLFAMIFTAVVGAMVVAVIARSRRPRLPAPAATVLVTGGVAASIAAIVVFLRHEPTAVRYLPPTAAGYLAVVLAGCLWIALASPRALGPNRLAPHLGAAAALVFAAWFLIVIRTDGIEPPLPVVLVLGPLLALTPIAVLVVPAFLAGRIGRSLRSGLQEVAWTLAGVMPLTYAIWLPEGLRRHAIDGRSLDGEVIAPVGANLTEALVFCLGILPAVAVTLGVIGAAFGAHSARTTENGVPSPT